MNIIFYECVYMLKTMLLLPLYRCKVHLDHRRPPRLISSAEVHAGTSTRSFATGRGEQT
jgi:hypothetical protein